MGCGLAAATGVASGSDAAGCGAAGLRRGDLRLWRSGSGAAGGEQQQQNGNISDQQSHAISSIAAMVYSITFALSPRVRLTSKNTAGGNALRSTQHAAKRERGSVHLRTTMSRGHRQRTHGVVRPRVGVGLEAHPDSWITDREWAEPSRSCVPIRHTQMVSQSSHLAVERGDAFADACVVRRRYSRLETTVRQPYASVEVADCHGALDEIRACPRSGGGLENHR